MRSKLGYSVNVMHCSIDINHLLVACDNIVNIHEHTPNVYTARRDIPLICSSLDSLIHQIMRLLNCTGHKLLS